MGTLLFEINLTIFSDLKTSRYSFDCNLFHVRLWFVFVLGLFEKRENAIFLDEKESNTLNNIFL